MATRFNDGSPGRIATASPLCGMIALQLGQVPSSFGRTRILQLAQTINIIFNLLREYLRTLDDAIEHNPFNFKNFIYFHNKAQRLARKPLGRLCTTRLIILTSPPKRIPTMTLSRRPSRLNALVGQLLFL
jgi:hypothetical protein